MTQSFQATVNHLSGQVAEGVVADLYLKGGASVSAQRWRGTRGEIDLVIDDCGTKVFCEVKKSKTFSQAAQALSPAQARRIQATALEYLAQHDLSQDTDMRFDLACVDAQGRTHIIENALM